MQLKNFREYLEAIQTMSYVQDPNKQVLTVSEIEEYKELKKEYFKALTSGKAVGTFNQWLALKKFAGEQK